MACCLPGWLPPTLQPRGGREWALTGGICGLGLTLMLRPVPSICPAGPAACPGQAWGPPLASPGCPPAPVRATERAVIGWTPAGSLALLTPVSHSHLRTVAVETKLLGQHSAVTHTHTHSPPANQVPQALSSHPHLPHSPCAHPVGLDPTKGGWRCPPRQGERSCLLAEPVC